MVVNWTGVPDRAGEWLMGFKGNTLDTWQSIVVTIDDNMFYDSGLIIPMKGPLECLLNHEVEILGHVSNYDIKFATTPIQINNVNFDFNYSK